MTQYLNTPSLAGLAHALRHPEMWPNGFVWNHAHPHQNAVGLAFRQWGGPRSYDDSNDSYLFDLSKLLQTNEVTMLCTHLPEAGRHFKSSPEAVAERIEKHLRRG